MSEFKKYRRKETAELRKYKKGDDMQYISVSVADSVRGSPKKGDMIARNPEDHLDQWLISAEYFNLNFEEI